MISRVPQPQFVGPTPAEVDAQAAARTQQYAQMFMTGVQEAAKNYIAQQEAETHKKNALTESQRLQATVLGESLYKDFEQKGPMSYIDRKEEWMQLFGISSGGDEKLAEAMYEGGAKGINAMSPMTAFKGGLLGIAQGEPSAPQAPTAATPAPTQAQPTAPAAPVAAETPASTPATETDPLEGFWNYMQSLHAGDSTMGAWKGQPFSPDKAQRLVKGNPVAYRDFLKTASGAPTQAPGESVSKSIEIAVPVKTPKTALAQQVLEKFEQGGLDAGTQITPKEAAAVKGTVDQVCKVMDNSEVKAYLAAGGSAEALSNAAKQINDAMVADPQFADYMRSASTLDPASAKEYLSFKAQDRQWQQMLGNLGIGQEKNAISRAGLALDAVKIENSLAIAIMRAKMSGDKESEAAFRTAVMAFNSYSQVYNNEVMKYLTLNKNAKQEDADKYMQKFLADKNSAIAQARQWATFLMSRATDTPVEVTQQLLEGDPGLLDRLGKALQTGLGLFGEKTAPKPYSAPGVPGVSIPKEAGQPSGTPPAPVAPPASKGGDYAKSLGF